jgi:nifR3 family TIM-barrel protein
MLYSTLKENEETSRISFWNILPKPIVGLSPMDGATDAAFRYIADRHGRPDVLFTEFVPVEAIKARAIKVLGAFRRHKTTTPTIAQIYGTDLDAYYATTLIICELGFDGVDINMGCPAKSVQSRGAGAGLIKNPQLASNIIKTVKKAIDDFHDGAYDSQIKDCDIRNMVNTMKIARTTKRKIPLSVKTRIGYDQPDTANWVEHLVSQDIDALTIHGRTLKQMYTGCANWDEILIGLHAAKTINKEIVFIGNGDIKSAREGVVVCERFGFDGVLIGRASLGNPWVLDRQRDFSKRVDREVIFYTMLEHARKFVEINPDANLISLRKHMLWYASDFENAKALHPRLSQIKSFADLSNVLSP